MYPGRSGYLLAFYLLAFLSFTLAAAAPTTTQPFEPTTTDVIEDDIEPVHTATESFGKRMYRKWEELLDPVADSEAVSESEIEFASPDDSSEGTEESELDTTSDWEAVEPEQELEQQRLQELEVQRQIQIKNRLLNNLSNAQRMARGLPLRKPRQMYDHRMGARAPAPSGAR